MRSLLPKIATRAAIALLLTGVAAVRLAAPLRGQADDLLTLQLLIGSVGTGPGQFVNPVGIAVDSSGRFIVADTETYDPITSEVAVASNRVQVFLPDGTFEREAGGMGSLPGQFRYPTSVAIDALDQIVVADGNNNRIQVLSPATSPGGPQFLAEYGTFGNYDPLDDTSNYPAPAPPDEFYFVTGVSIKPGTRLLDPTDTVGRLAIVDLGNHRVVVLNSQLQYVREFGGHSTDDNPTGTFEYPWGVAIGPGGEYFVTDPSNHRVQVFSPAGQYLWSFGADTSTSVPGPGDLSSPSGLAFDSAARLLVADTDRSRIIRIDLVTDLGSSSALPPCSDVSLANLLDHCQIVTSDGRHLGAFVLGGFGFGDSDFLYAEGIASDAQGRVAVADSGQSRVKVFQPARIEFGDVTTDSGPLGARVDHPIALNVAVANRGGSDLTVSLAVDASLLGVFSGNTSAPIAAGAEQTFVLTFVPGEAGPLNLTVRAEGLHASGARLVAVPFTLPAIDVAPALAPKLSVIAAATSSTVGVGHTIGVTVRLVNSGNTTFDTIAPIISASPAGLVSAVPGTPDLGPLEPGMRELSYSFTALREGNVTFTVNVTATYPDPDNPSASVTYPTPPAAPLSATTGEVAIRQDTTPPTTTATPSAEVGASGWYRTPFTVSLGADDQGGSGVRTITYRLISIFETAATTTQNPTSVPITFQGTSSLIYYATDQTGNSESPHTVNYRLDSVPPVMGRVDALPAPNAAGWNRTDVVVTFVAGDGTSGIASVTAPVTVTTEGAGQIIKGTARDAAGNQTEAQTVLNIDKTPPVLTSVLSSAPNANGWHNQPVTVTFSATDQPGLSGVAAVAAPQTISADGIATITGTATDMAGNTSTRSVTIKMDRTPPVVTCGTVNGGVIWPPNHKLVAWQTAVLVSDLTSGPGGFILTAATSSEPDDARKGDGRTTDDIQGFVVGSPDTFGFVRAERSGTGGGRVYSLFYEGSDLAGNTTACSVVTAEVPHDSGAKNNRENKAAAKRR